MTVKEKLYHLVNALPETELVAAERYLEYLAHSADCCEPQFVGHFGLMN